MLALYYKQARLIPQLLMGIGCPLLMLDNRVLMMMMIERVYCSVCGAVS
jgi:hypothetical protein